jgi:tetratricopeptide (TPR) repeat protein
VEVAETAALDADHVHEALSEAIATNIVLPSAGERFRFSHVLLRDKLYADLRPRTRATLHFQAGTATLRGGGTAEAAVHHLFEGQSAGTPARVAEVALSAAQASLSRLAFEDAVQLGRRALQLPGAGELPELLRAELEVVVAEGLIRLGDSAEGKALCARAAARAERAAAGELLARAALVYGTELASGTLDPQMIALLRQALAATSGGDSSLRARLMTRLAAALTPPASVDDGPEILALMREATNMARRLEDPDALLYTLQFSATVGLLVPENERFRMLEETLALARALGQPLVVLNTLPAYITALLGLGRRADAEARLPEYVELLGESRQPVHRTRYLIVNALLLTLRGDFEEADRLGSEARLLAHSTGSRAALFLLLTHRLSLAILRKQPAVVADEQDSLVELFAPMSGSRPYVAWFLAGTGRADQARELLSAVSLEPIPHAPARLWEILGLAETCVLLGNPELGERVYPELLRAADRMFWNTAPGAIIGPSARVLGDLAQLIGRVPDAIRHYDEAIAFCEKLASPPLVESCRAARNAAQALLPAAGAAPVPESPRREPLANPRAELALRREGELWTLTTPAGATLRLKHGKGFAYLQYLLDRPGTDVHVLELAGVEHRAGDAGPVLDARAKAEYRQRVDALREELEEAERFGDTVRATRAREELDTIAEQLAGAVGLGGRDRRAASDVERARINVQRRLKDAIERITQADPALGRYLSRAVKTGTTCSYQVL